MRVLNVGILLLVVKLFFRLNSMTAMTLSLFTISMFRS
nr:MAG TPA: hypothetical protein [Caudoviricetes sp.]